MVTEKFFVKICILFATFSVCMSLAFSCFQQEAYSDVPQIINSSIYTYRHLPTSTGRGSLDSVVIKINARDGDNDLGIDEPISATDVLHFINNGNWTNYKITTLRLVGDKFVAAQSSDARNIAFFPKLTGFNVRGNVEGYLYFNRIFIYSQNFKLYPTKFQIQIRDNKLNESNIIETDTVIVPYSL